MDSELLFQRNEMNSHRPVNGKELEKLLGEGLLKRSASNDRFDPIDESGAVNNLRVRFFIALYHCIEKDLELIRICGAFCEQSLPLEEIHLKTGFPVERIKHLAEISQHLFLSGEALEADYVVVWYRYLRHLLTPNGYTAKDRKRDLTLLSSTLRSRKKLKRRIRELEEKLHHLTSVIASMAQKQNELP